ncbi:MAG: hypothetical protein KDD15_12525 [Lewinella sp.]|nr:hypothetical protein [Lewinella sp.]
MPRSSEDIVRDLLREAGYYWYNDNADDVDPINPDDFDPIVDKMFKANAVELEKLYAEIDESRQEVILGLAKALVPDQSLLPEPGYTVAQIKPKSDRINTSPEDSFLIGGQSATGERYEYYFTPLFEHDYPGCEVIAIITDKLAVQVDQDVPQIVYGTMDGTSTGHVWYGLRIGSVNEDDIIPFFLGKRVVDEFDKDHFAFRQAQWLLNGDPKLELRVQNGVQAFASRSAKKVGGFIFPDILQVPDTYEKQILSRFRNGFIHLALPSDLGGLRHHFPPPLHQSELAAALTIKESLIWVRVEFTLPVSQEFLTSHMLYPNCIPMVNRRIRENTVVKSGFDRILLPMPTVDLFLDVHRVQDTRNKEDGTEYERIDFLEPDSRPGTYLLRGGSRVRRLNREDASRQIRRLLEVIHEEYSTFKEEGVNRLREDFDVIEKAINRIRQQLPDMFREEERRSTFFCIATFRPHVSRITYRYWETQGNVIADLGTRTGLEVTSSDVKIGKSRSIIAIQKGKGELSSDDYINQLKISLLSRGRIMTRGDIVLYCRSRYGNMLKVVNILHRLMLLADGQRGRGILVVVQFLQNLSAGETESIRLALQNDLNARSTFFTQIKVELQHEA